MKATNHNPRPPSGKDRGVYPHENRTGSRDSVLVSKSQSIDIHADIDSIDGSFRGELSNESGVSRSFSGWTEFATALVALAEVKGTTEPENPNEENTK